MVHFKVTYRSTTRNELIYRKHTPKGEIDIDKDEHGLHQMKYEVDSVENDIYK